MAAFLQHAPAQRSYADLTDAEVDEIGRALDALREDVLADRGARDAAYVRRVIAAQRCLEVAGRVVLLTSDHGHVVDRGPDGDVYFQRSGAGARWRPGAEDVRDDEVRLRGSRVQLGDGDVVAAVAETLRYKQRNEGYHGGAALAELAIPFVALARRGWHVAGWKAVPPSAPAWWEGPVDLGATGRSDGTLFS